MVDVTVSQSQRVILILVYESSNIIIIESFTVPCS